MATITRRRTEEEPTSCFEDSSGFQGRLGRHSDSWGLTDLSCWAHIHCRPDLIAALNRGVAILNLKQMKRAT